MSYAWDKTMNLLGGGQEEDQQGQGQNVISSSEGDLSGGGQTPSGPQAVAPQQQAATPTAGSKSAVMKRNLGKSQAPADLGKMQGTVTTARQNLQNEANAYVESADDPDEQRMGEVGQTVKQFADTGQKADWLNQLDAKRYVAGPDLKTNTEVEDINFLQNDAGIRELFRRQQDPEGTIGEAALDTALLRQNQDFGKTRDLLMKDFGALQSERMKMPDELKPKAQEKADAAQAALRAKVMQEAEGMAAGYEDLAKQRELDFDKELAALEAARYAKMQDEAQAYIDQMAASGNYDPFVSKALSQSLGAGALFNPDAIDVSQFYSAGIDPNATDYKQFYGEPEAQGFERIMGLLGKGGETRMAGPYAGKSAQDALGGGLDFNALSDAALQFATRYGGQARDAEAANAKIAEDKRLEKEDIANRVANDKILNAPATPEEIVAVQNKNEDEYTEREKVISKRMAEEAKQKQDKRGMGSWNPVKW